MDKTNKSGTDVILYDGKVVVFKMEGDVMMYVVGGGEENEILLFGVVIALRDALSILLKWVFYFFSLGFSKMGRFELRQGVFIGILRIRGHW